MQRVMILGQPGAGKSWLAQWLAAQAGLPVVHLDRIHWLPGWQVRPKDERIALCLEAESQERWIIDGQFGSTSAHRVARADLVIWLDVGLPRRLWRVVRRQLDPRATPRPDLPEGCSEEARLLPGFLLYIMATRHKGRADILRVIAMAPPGLRVVTLRNRAELRAFQAEILAGISAAT